MSSSTNESLTEVDGELQSQQISQTESNMYLPLQYSTTPEVANLTNEISVLSSDNKATLDKRSAEVLI